VASARLFTTVQAPADLVAEIRRLLGPACEGEFPDADWQHALGS